MCSIYRFYFPLYILWAYIFIFFSLFMCIIYFSTTVSTLWKSIYFNSHFREALLIDSKRERNYCVPRAGLYPLP